MIIYIQDLNRGDPQEPILPFEVPGEDWDKRLAHCCQAIIRLNPRLKTNAQVLETYYQLGSVMAEKEWGETAKRKLRTYFSMGKGKIVAKMSKRKMYEEDFTDHLLKKAQDQRRIEMDHILNDSQELIFSREG
ncbi:hypothetical protein C2G38_2224002 [Gigaspora rosea]|uniref:Uncharacterized protein n=1 Tax=Gigaspora rosea TaxID=44941 RepID=A0A397U0W1_9GLOM|nr:hypothetical protein C2G38_2224002 [Gigaspora rosea]